MSLRRTWVLLVLLMLVVSGVLCADTCKLSSDCNDGDPCTDDYCDESTSECVVDAIPDCIKCTNSTGGISGCAPVDDCHAVACNVTLKDPCVQTAMTNCTVNGTSLNFTSLGVMLGFVAMYAVSLFFALRDDKEKLPHLQSPFYKIDENLANNAGAVETGAARKLTASSPSEESIGPNGAETAQGKGEDAGCCSCCGGGRKSKTPAAPEQEKERGFLSTLVSKYPLTKADKVTLTLCTVLSNIVFSAALNHHGVTSEQTQQYFIGLISGSVALPIMTIITLSFTRMPRQHIIFSYGIAYAFCVACFIVTMIYTVRLEQTKANKWLVSTAISNGQDIFMVAVSYVMVVFCPCLAKQKQLK